MKAASIVGKRIARVHQYRFDDNNASGQAPFVIEAIEFTDGSFLRFCVVEPDQGCEYGVYGIYPAREIKAPKTLMDDAANVADKPDTP